MDTNAGLREFRKLSTASGTRVILFSGFGTSLPCRFPCSVPPYSHGISADLSRELTIGSGASSGVGTSSASDGTSGATSTGGVTSAANLWQETVIDGTVNEFRSPPSFCARMFGNVTWVGLYTHTLSLSLSLSHMNYKM